MSEAKRLAEELAETREELDDLQNQLDQQLEDHNKEMEEFEDNLKNQYSDEIRTRDETIAALEQQVTDTNAYWQAEFDKLQAEKDAMYTDYESKLATWEKKRGPSGWVWENPITGETANEDKTWKNPREVAMDEKMKNMEEKMERLVAKSRKGGVQDQEKQTLINKLKVDLKNERAAHLAIQEAKTLVDLHWTQELERLETVLVQLNEKSELYKMAFEEEETRRISAIQTADARVMRVEIQSGEAIKEHKRQIKYAEIRQKALERELRRQVAQRNQSGLAQAELEMKLFLFDEIKQQEFDVLRTKLRKARETHQDDLESLSCLWPPASDGYLLPTILKPFTDVARVEQDRAAVIAKARKKGLHIPEEELSDTDSDDEEAHIARRDLEKQLAMYKKEALMPSLRNLDPEEGPRFKAVSMTPRRRRYVLYDTPRLYQPDTQRSEETEVDNLTERSAESAKSRPDDPLYKAFRYSARNTGQESARSESSSQAIASAVRLKLRLPPALAQHRPATALAAIARKDYGAEPWDSDDEIDQNYQPVFERKEGKSGHERRGGRRERKGKSTTQRVVEVPSSPPKSKGPGPAPKAPSSEAAALALPLAPPVADGADASAQKAIKEETMKAEKEPVKPVDPEVLGCMGSLLDKVEYRMGTFNLKNEVLSVLGRVVDDVEFKGEFVPKDIVGGIIDKACAEAPSTIQFLADQQKARELKLDRIRNPWKGEKSRVMANVPKVFARALRSMLRNGTITKPRARQLANLYSKAPTLSEEDEAMVNDGRITERSVKSLVGETIKLAEEDEPEKDFEGDETVEGQADTRGRNESIRLLRREAELIEGVTMMHEQERRLLVRRRKQIEAVLAREQERTNLTKADIDSRSLVQGSKSALAKKMEADIMSIQQNADAREEEWLPGSTVRRMPWVPSCTSVVPLPLDFKPDLIVHKTRTKTRIVKYKITESRTNSEGEEETVEVEKEKEEQYEEAYTEELSVPEAIEREATRVVEIIASYTQTKTRVVEYQEVNDEGESVTKEKTETYEAPLFPAPIKVEIKEWVKEDLDPKNAKAWPEKAFYIEMPAPDDLESLLSRLVLRIDKVFPIARASLGQMFQVRTVKDRFELHQESRRVSLKALRRYVQVETNKLNILERRYNNSAGASQMLSNKLAFVNEEVDSLNRRLGQTNRLYKIAQNLKFWIVKAVDRSKQTKEELVLLARNAEDRVARAKQKVIDAGNPLEEAAMEDNLDRVLRESDRILRYVRRRFHSEMDTRRRLAEERRDIIRQQNSRYEVTLAMGDERISEIRKVFKEQQKESTALSAWHCELERSVFRENRRLLNTEYDYCSSFKKYANPCGDLPDAYDAALDVLNDVCVAAFSAPLKFEIVQEGAPPLRTAVRVILEEDKIEEVQSSVQTKESIRVGARKRELGMIQEAVDTLDGYAGQWLADNEVQQIEGQLSLTRTTLDEVQKEAKKTDKESKDKIKDLQSRLDARMNQLEATKQMFESELSALRMSSTRSINYLKDVVMATKDAMETLRKEKDAEIMRMAEAHAKKISEMTAKMEELEKVAERRKKWVQSLQVQIGRMRAEAKRIELLRIAEHNAWEKERDGLTQQLEFHISQSDRRLQWVNSLKREISVKEKEKQKVLKQMNIAAAKHADLERELRWNIWQRDETARQIRMDVDSAFLFFAETISQLAGVSRQHNDQIAMNGGVGVLAAMINRDCGRKELKPLASKALAAVSWNGHVDHRVVSRRARDAWSSWTGRVSAAEKWRFDLGEKERLGIIKAEKLAMKAFQSNKAEAFSLANRTVRLLKAAFVSSLSAKSRAARDAEVLREGQTVVGHPTPDYRHAAPNSKKVRVEQVDDVVANTGPHEDNQSAIGSTHGALSSLVHLCQQNDPSLQRYATDAIAVLALNVSNREKLEQVQECAPTLVELLDEERIAEVQRNAAAAIGNMAFENPSNQSQLGDCGAVEALVALCARKDTDIDVLENSAAALGNLARRNEANSLRIGICGGIEALVRLVNSGRTADLNDGERVQANAAEALVNATRNDSHENAERVRACGIRPLVLLCTSKNLSVQRSSALVLGNIAQNDQNRIEIGSKGGIDALFILAAEQDRVVQANAAWALGNLAWSASNQERIGFHMPRLLQMLNSKHDDVRGNAIICVANALFYNESNRRRVAFDNLDGLDLLIELLGDTSTTVQQHAARAIGSAAHNDNVAKVGGERGAIGGLVKLCYSSEPQCQRYAAFALGNFALYDPNKKIILQGNGVEALTFLMGSESHQARDLASDCLETLADLADENDMQMAKDKFGVGGTIDLLRGDNPLVIGMAADSLADMVWKGGETERTSIINAGGMEALHGLVSDTKPHGTQLKALWALHTIVGDNGHAKDRACTCGLVETLLKALEVTPASSDEWRQLNEIKEVSLSLLAKLIVGHEKNCRRVLRMGLDTLIQMAEEGLPEPPRVARTGKAGGGGLENLVEKPKPWQVSTKSNSAVALDLLQMIGPHNWILCSNCGTRNEGGTRCFHCAHSIAFVL
jgi:hypothetical protein